MFGGKNDIFLRSSSLLFANRLYNSFILFNKICIKKIYSFENEMKERFQRIRSFDCPEIHKIKEKTYKLLFCSYVFKSNWSKYAATMYSLEFGATYWLLYCMGKRM